MAWTKMIRKVNRDKLQKYVSSYLCIVVLGSLFVATPLLAQKVTIEGTVVLEGSKQTVQTDVGGYQNTPQGSSFSEADPSSNKVVIWLEAKNKKTTFDAKGKPDDMSVLDQVDKHFKPRLMVIQVGDVVRIHNSDPVYHNVFSLSKTKRFDVGRRSPGDYKDVEFDKAGKVDVFCDIHSDMHAVIAVAPEQTVAMQKLQSGEKFRFTDLPQGEYVLHLLALENRSKKIDIQAIDTQRVTLQTIRLGS